MTFFLQTFTNRKSSFIWLCKSWTETRFGITQFVGYSTNQGTGRFWLVLVLINSQPNLPFLHAFDSCKDCLASRTVCFFCWQAKVVLLLTTQASSGHSLFSDHLVTTGARKTCLPSTRSRSRLSSAKVWPGHWVGKWEHMIFSNILCNFENNPKNLNKSQNSKNS